MLYLYCGTAADENNRLCSTGGEPATRRAAEDVLFAGTREECCAWAQAHGWTVIWLAM